MSTSKQYVDVIEMMHDQETSPTVWAAYARTIVDELARVTAERDEALSDAAAARQEAKVAREPRREAQRIAENRIRGLIAERDQLAAELANKTEINRRACVEWAETDTAIKAICAKHGVKGDDDPSGFKCMEACVEELSDKVAALERERDELKDANAKLVLENLGIFGDHSDKWGTKVKELVTERDSLAAELREAREQRDALAATLHEQCYAVMCIRCTSHIAVPMQNTNEIAGGECGGCIAAERDALRAESKEAREQLAVLQSQVDNADINLEQVRLNQKSMWRTKIESCESALTAALAQIEKLRGEVQYLQQTVVQIAVPIEVLVGHHHANPFRELSPELMQDFFAAMLKCRAVAKSAALSEQQGKGGATAEVKEFNEAVESYENEERASMEDHER